MSHNLCPKESTNKKHLCGHDCHFCPNRFFGKAKPFENYFKHPSFIYGKIKRVNKIKPSAEQGTIQG
jgi:hypothetical protein